MTSVANGTSTSIPLSPSTSLTSTATYSPSVLTTVPLSSTSSSVISSSSSAPSTSSSPPSVSTSTSTSTHTTTTTTKSTTPTSYSSSSSSSQASSSTSSTQVPTSQTTNSSSTFETSTTPSPTISTETSTVQPPLPTVHLSNSQQLLSTSTAPPLPPTTTFKSTIQVTIIDSTGGIITIAPSVFTAIVTSTASNGIVVTVTQVGVNQTLSPNRNNSDQSSFFRNTGAVVGVFVLVGLAAASILLWILFAVRRRRRNQKLEHDTAVSATLAAAGFHRAPLDEDEDDVDVNGSRRMNQRSTSGLAIGTTSSAPSGARTSAYIDSPFPDDLEAFNPYNDYTFPGGAREGYIPVTTMPLSNGEVKGPGGDYVINHSASHSAGSYEPLLAYHHRSTQLPSPPPRLSLRISGAGRTPPLVSLSLGLSDPDISDNNATSGASSSSSQRDERLDPGIRHRLSGDADHASDVDFRDDEDYSRPILGIRNLPDTVAQDSQES